jgi:MFS family permease
VVNAYLIAFGGLLLLSGRFGDTLGRKRMFMFGLAVFTLASLWCGLAQSQGMLVAARFVQGVGGALTSAVILGMIATMFPEPQDAGLAPGLVNTDPPGWRSPGSGGARDALGDAERQPSGRR